MVGVMPEAMDHERRIEPVVQAEDPFAYRQGPAETLTGIEPLPVAGGGDDDAPQADRPAASGQEGCVGPVVEGPSPEQVEGGEHGQAAVAMADQAHAAAGRKPLDEPGEV